MGKKFKTELVLVISLLLVIFTFSVGFFYIGSLTSGANISWISNLLDSSDWPYKLGTYLFSFGSISALIVLIASIFKSVSYLEKKAREAERAKNEFVSLASHQLRTPLSTVNWYVELLLSEEAGKTNEVQKQYLDEIYSGNQRMIELVNALLYVDLGSFVVEPQPSNLEEIADGVVNEFSPQIHRKRIEIVKKYDQNLSLVKTDPNLIWIVFQNFLSNALKYSHEGGKVVVAIRKAEKETVISVSDYGYGIPKDQQNKIFNRLFRANNIVQKSEGTGLGLYLVKAIANQTNSKTWFESEENKGTTFYFSIPSDKSVG